VERGGGTISGNTRRQKVPRSAWEAASKEASLAGALMDDNG